MTTQKCIWWFLQILYKTFIILLRKEDTLNETHSRAGVKKLSETPDISARAYTSASAGASRIEIYCFIGNHLNAGGLFYEVTTKEWLLGKWLLWAASIYFTPARSFATETSKLLLKLLTIRRSQIKIRAFFVEVEIYARRAALLQFIAS